MEHQTSEQSLVCYPAVGHSKTGPSQAWKVHNEFLLQTPEVIWPDKDIIKFYAPILCSKCQAWRKKSTSENEYRFSETLQYVFVGIKYIILLPNCLT